MNWFNKVKSWLEIKRHKAVFDRSVSNNPLREFIYLDEVSLRSLLSSQKGEITSSTSEEVTKSFEGEYRSSASMGSDKVGKGELASRFQTRNSSTLQTAKKATVQSWFRELDKIRGIRLLETVQQVRSFAEISKLSTCSNPSVSVNTANLKRGEIVEFRVRLAADPIFHIVTLASEFKAMAEDYPEMVAVNGGLKQFNEIEGISKVLQRLLAGLIPVRAELLDYVVVEVEGKEYLAHVDAVQGLNIQQRPLEIVCVTELDAYWKDIRRVLFSNAEFTMLCRVSKNGLQKKWTPVKLADLLAEFVPDLTEQLNNAAEFIFNSSRSQKHRVDEEVTLRAALSIYADAFSFELEDNVPQSVKDDVRSLIDSLEVDDKSVTYQKAAFKTVADFLSDKLGKSIDPEKDLLLREQARMSVRLPYFKSLTPNPAVTPSTPAKKTDENRYLDVEVVAMYW